MKSQRDEENRAASSEAEGKDEDDDDDDELRKLQTVVLMLMIIIIIGLVHCVRVYTTYYAFSPLIRSCVLLIHRLVSKVVETTTTFYMTFSLPFCSFH